MFAQIKAESFKKHLLRELKPVLIIQGDVESGEYELSDQCTT